MTKIIFAKISGLLKIMLRNSLIFLSLFVITRPLKTNAQGIYAAFSMDTLKVHVEKRLSDDRLYKVKMYTDTIKKNSLNFFQDKLLWAIKMSNGGCASKKDLENMESYILFLRDELEDIELKLDSFQTKKEEEIRLEVEMEIVKGIEKIKEQKEIELLFDNKGILYKDDRIKDITQDILLTINKDIDLAKYPVYEPGLFLLETKRRVAMFPEYKAFMERKN